jgi:ADP-heptose:LPS heptosyltransferase
MGDVLMCTPALRELKLRTPKLHIRFYTNYSALVRGLPYIDEVLPFDQRPRDTIFMRYEDVTPPPEHIAKVIGGNLGLDIKDIRPDCMVDRIAVKGFQKEWCRLPRPCIVVQRRASRWTPNKDWPPEYWGQLIHNLSRRAGIIEIGEKISDHPAPLENYVDLREGTLLEELPALLAAGDIFVGPVSGPAHVAAAVGTPAVVIIGGYEHPRNTRYNGNINLYTGVRCAPCWLREPCPYERKCLKAIHPEIVEAEIWKAWENGISLREDR